MNAQVRFAILEDDRGFRERLREALHQHPGWRVAAECGDVESALREIPPSNPDVIIVDVQLPGFSGVEAIARLKSETPKCQILILTIVDDPDLIVRAMESGADGYLLKGDTGELLRENIQAFLKGEGLISPTIASRIVSWFHAPRGPAGCADFGLTEHQLRILFLRGRGRTYDEIAVELGISSNTVRNHIGNILRKLGVSSSAEAYYKITGGSKKS